MTSKQTLEILRTPVHESADGRVRPIICGKTDVGCVRSNNEDQFLVARLERALVLEQSGFPIDTTENRRIQDEPGRLLIVADGMGGHDGGELASTVAIDAMAKYAFTMMPWLGNAAGNVGSTALATGLRDAVREAQQKVRDAARRKGVATSLGTTLTMAYVSWPDCFLVHVGDSRAYLLRQGELFRLTKDHNLAQSMVQRGVMTEEEAATSRFSSVLTNALGGSNDDLHVEMHHFELARHDRMLLCTDGLYGEVGDEAVARALTSCTRGDYAPLAVDTLIQQAKDAGGNDNVTAVLACF